MTSIRMPFWVLILLVLSSASARILVKHQDPQQQLGDNKPALGTAIRNLLENSIQHDSTKADTTTNDAITNDAAIRQAGSAAIYPPINAPAATPPAHQAAQAPGIIQPAHVGQSTCAKCQSEMLAKCEDAGMSCGCPAEDCWLPICMCIALP